jgi:hypothetical protein
MEGLDGLRDLATNSYARRLKAMLSEDGELRCPRTGVSDTMSTQDDSCRWPGRDGVIAPVAALRFRRQRDRCAGSQPEYKDHLRRAIFTDDDLSELDARGLNPEALTA